MGPFAFLVDGKIFNLRWSPIKYLQYVYPEQKAVCESSRDIVCCQASSRQEAMRMSKGMKTMGFGEDSNANIHQKWVETKCL